MLDVEFTTEDFENLKFIEKFNQEHWKAKQSALGWNYDVENNDPQIIKIQKSLRNIKGKLKRIGEYFIAKDNYKNLSFRVQKINDGITSRYLSILWLYFIKQYEKRAPNEPQLQLTITPQNIDISLWFENDFAIRNYLLRFIDNFQNHIKQDNQISITVFTPGLGSKLLKKYSNTGWDNFVKQISELKFECKVGFSYLIPKETVLSLGEEVFASIEDNLDRAKIYFDKATQTGEQILGTNELDILNLFMKKQQVILYGPPGTGKTYSTKKYCIRLIEND